MNERVSLYQTIPNLTKRQKKVLIKRIGLYQPKHIKDMIQEVVEHHLKEPFPEFTALVWVPESCEWLLDTCNWPPLQFETKDVRDRVLYIYYQISGRPHVFNSLDRETLNKFNQESERWATCATIV